MTDLKLGFIGAGQMARALAAGFTKAGLLRPKQILVSDPIAAALEEFSAVVPGSVHAEDNRALIDRANVVILAVKPQMIDAVLTGIQSKVTDNHLIISIAAGVSLAQIRDQIGATGRLIRLMPNTPCLVGQSAGAFCLDPSATEDDAKLVTKFCESVGIAFRVEEKLMDAVTGLSGSGPAFVYLMIEALSDGGVLMGLPRPVALQLAAQTVRGAAKMVLETGEHPSVLKDRVTSPGGTTVAGLQALENHGFRAAILSAVKAATERSGELGGTSSDQKKSE